MGFLVLSLLKVCHHAVHDVWLRREEIESFDIAVSRPSVGDLFDVWSKSIDVECSRHGHGIRRTGDVLVQQSVFVDHVVKEFLRIAIDYQDFPLRSMIQQGWSRLLEVGVHTSCSVMWCIVPRMTMARSVYVNDRLADEPTIALGVHQ